MDRRIRRRDHRPAACGRTGNTAALFGFGSVAPYQPPIDTCQKIIDVHAEIGIKPRLEVERTVHDGHHQPHEPEVDVGPVFEPQIEQPQRKADDLQDEFEFHRLKPHRYVGQHVEHRLGKIEGRIFAHTSDNRRITVAVVTILRIEKIVDLHAETHASDLRGSQFIPQVQVGDTVVVERQRIVAAVGKVLFADILRMQQGAEPFDMEIQ